MCSAENENRNSGDDSRKDIEDHGYWRGKAISNFFLSVDQISLNVDQVLGSYLMNYQYSTVQIYKERERERELKINPNLAILLSAFSTVSSK